MRRPTERRAYLAAKQLAHHRARLPWMREQMEENERLLRERLEESGERRLVLSGGFAIARAENGGVIVGRLPIAKNRFEQLELDAIRTTEDTPKEGDTDERRTEDHGARGKARP